MGGDHEVGLSVVQSVPEGGDPHSDVSCLVGESAMSLDLCRKRDVVFLLQGPVYRGCVELSVVEEEGLPPVVGCVRNFLWSSMKGTRVNRTVPSVGHEKLRAEGCEVDANERSDMELPSRVWNELEESVPRIFEVAEPVSPRWNSWLGLYLLYCFRDDFGFYRS